MFALRKHPVSRRWLVERSPFAKGIIHGAGNTINEALMSGIKFAHTWIPIHDKQNDMPGMLEMNRLAQFCIHHLHAFNRRNTMSVYIVAVASGYRTSVQTSIRLQDKQARFENIPGIETFWVMTSLALDSMDQELFPGMAQAIPSVRTKIQGSLPVFRENPNMGRQN